jgi:two-component system, response regulator PdtaR
MQLAAQPRRNIALVVEDDQDLRELVTLLLEEVDMKVVTCGTAEAAFAIMEHTGDDVALLFADVVLPGACDGVQLANRVTRQWPGTTVIVTSGGPHPEALDPGTTYLPKPWRALDVLAHVA